MRDSVHDGCAACQNVEIHYLDRFGAGHSIRQDRRRAVLHLDTGSGAKLCGEKWAGRPRSLIGELDQSACWTTAADS